MSDKAFELNSINSEAAIHAQQPLGMVRLEEHIAEVERTRQRSIVLFFPGGQMRKSVLTLMLFSAFTSVPMIALAATSDGMSEANAIQTKEAQGSGHPAYSPGHGVAFKTKDHVYIKSALAVDFTYRKATVTLPLYRGLSPSGKDVFYILTDASDFEVARRLGINYAPKLAAAVGSAGAQTVTVNDGVLQFQGNVDFSPAYKVAPGDPPGYFPPKAADPGAVADEKWSSIVVLPSGLVLNAQIVQNDSGAHDRLKSIDLKNRSVTMSILDGVQGGKQYFYHLVTDASAAVPAVLEKGVFAPALAKIPSFGQSMPGRKIRVARLLAGA